MLLLMTHRHTTYHSHGTDGDSDIIGRPCHISVFSFDPDESWQVSLFVIKVKARSIRWGISAHEAVQASRRDVAPAQGLF